MPWALDYPEAVRALRVATMRPILVDVSCDEYAYGRLINLLWEKGDGFIIVEHDVVVRPDTIRELEDCPEPYCGFPYHEAKGWPVLGLGCTKISAEVVQAVHLTGEPMLWQNIDATVPPAIRAVGYTQHQHWPWLRHLNPRVVDEPVSEGGLIL